MAKMKKKVEAEVPVEAPVETPPPAVEKITQREAVKRALASGADSPSDGVQFIKAKFDIQLNNQAFSTLKSQLKKAEGNGKPEIAPMPRLVKTGGNGVGNGSPAALALAVKQLVALHGADAVKGMVDVFKS